MPGTVISLRDTSSFSSTPGDLLIEIRDFAIEAGEKPIVTMSEPDHVLFLGLGIWILGVLGEAVERYEERSQGSTMAPPTRQQSNVLLLIGLLPARPVDHWTDPFSAENRCPPQCLGPRSASLASLNLPRI
jgi:hypothetical protein